MKTCENCKHFEQFNYSIHGSCNVKLPPWLAELVRHAEQRLDVISSPAVDAGDTCDLWVVKE